METALCPGVFNPIASANASGTPNRRTEREEEPNGARLRANRSSHERRVWARWARERMGYCSGVEGGRTGGQVMSTRWCRSRCIQARRCSLRLQSRQNSGSLPTLSGCSSTLTWRGFLVELPFHWHCSRSSQKRQLRILAAYTSRRLPSASCRRSWSVSVLPAGQRRVPSGWSGKSVPVKRPVLKEVAAAGGRYPEAGAEEAGCVTAWELGSERAGANSVMRSGVGSNWCPSSSRRFQVHCEITCQHSCPQAE